MSGDALTGPQIVVGSIAGALVIGAVCLWQLRQGASPGGRTVVADTDANLVPTAKQPTESDALTELRALPSLSAAIARARPHTGAALNKHSAASGLLVGWATSRLTYEMVYVAHNQTSPAKVRKDADAEFGKRVCAVGEVVEIATHREAGAKYYSGLLYVAGSEEIVAFLAVGSTGEIVERSRAMFCGVTTGLFRYETKAQKLEVAIELVGMFDLPENKRPKVAPAKAAAPAAAHPAATTVSVDDLPSAK